MSKPKFNPNQPFEAMDKPGSKPKFDPSQPFEEQRYVQSPEELKAEADATVMAEKKYEYDNRPENKVGRFLSATNAMFEDYSPLTGLNDRAKAGLDALTTDKSYDQSFKETREQREADKAKSTAGRVTGALLGIGANTIVPGGEVAGAVIGGAEGALRSDDLLSWDAAQNAAMNATMNVLIPGAIEAVPQAAKAAPNPIKAGKAAVEATKGLGEVIGPAFKEGAKAGREVAGVDISSVPLVSQGMQLARGTLNAGKEVLTTNKMKAEQARIAQKALEQLETGNPSEKREAIETIQRYWEGSPTDMTNADVIGTRAIAGGEHNAATDYIANQAAAFGVPAHEYKQLLKMSPERLFEVQNFDKRAAADDAAPLLGELRDTFDQVRLDRMGQLKKAARAEFNTDPRPVLEQMQKAFASAGELKTTGGAQNPISDAYDIIRNGKGAETFEFAPGHIDEIDAGSIFDRLQAARSHIDDNIDWIAIKKGTRSPTPVEKVLMKVRSSLDQALKGGSESKIESDALFRKSKELEERFFKLAQDKDGIHEVSLAKLFGNNDRAVKAKQYMEELVEFSKRPDLSPKLRESTDAFVAKMQEAMQTAEDKRLYQEFSRKTRGPTGPAVERMGNSLGKRSVANQFIMTPGTALDVKAQAAEMAERAFGKPYSKLDQRQQLAITKQLAWQQSKAIAQEPVDAEMAAQNWQKIMNEL